MRVIFALIAAIVCSQADAAWLKGNIHTHTLESDGDSSPEEVVRWYREHGYDFLVITDHHKVTRVDGGEMVMIPGEEVTDRLPKRPLHVNAIGIERAIPPQRGANAVDVLQRNVDAVWAEGGIALINHPNFGWAFGAKELLQIDRFLLLEVASGHPYVNMHGPPSVEAMWDELLTAGKRVFAAAVDDTHHLKNPLDEGHVPPGRAWIVVRAAERTPEAILGAIERGDFYASMGPEIEDYAVGAESMLVCVKEKNTARYRVQFIGANGRVLQESAGNAATYTFRGDETYVRAKVIDSNGKAAWLQPVIRARSRSK